MELPRPFDLGELPLQVLDACAYHAPVDLELGLALPATHSDTANLTRQVGPATGQARQLILELRHLDLGTSLARLRPPNEEVEDQGTPINDGTRDDLFEVPDLTGRQVVVEDHHVGLRLGRDACELTGFAPANEGSRVRRSSVLQTPSNHFHPGASGELCQLVEVLFDDEARLTRQRQAHEEGARRGTFGWHRLVGIQSIGTSR